MQYTTAQMKLQNASEVQAPDANNNVTDGSKEAQCCHCGWRGSHAPNCPFR